MPMSLGELEAKYRALEALTISNVTALFDDGKLVISVERHGLEPLRTSVAWPITGAGIARPDFDPPVPRGRSLPAEPPQTRKSTPEKGS